MSVKRPQRKTLFVTRISQLDAAYEYIHNKLARGELEPGQKLSRRKLAEEIGASPALVQHVLGQLEKAGLVECRAQSGTYVRSMTEQEFSNLCDLRELIEPYAASRAAERITPAQLKILENSCRRYQALEDRIATAASDHELWKIHRELVEEERVFHGTILSAAGNDLLTSMIQSLRVLAQVPHQFAKTSLTKNLRSCEEHRQIVAALKAHDAELASRCMLEHIHAGSDFLRQRLHALSRTEAAMPSQQPMSAG